MRTIYTGIFLGLIWYGFYSILPMLTNPIFIVAAFALSSFMTMVISAVVMANK